MQIGDLVIKGTDVLRITGQCEQSVGDGPAQPYWVLEKAYPSGRTGFILRVPMQGESSSLHEIPSADEWREIVNEAVGKGKFTWVKERMKRIEQFRVILASGDMVDALRLFQTFHAYRLAEVGTLSAKDKEYESRTNSYVSDVLAASIDVTPETALQMIEEAVC